MPKKTKITDIIKGLGEVKEHSNFIELSVPSEKYHEICEELKNKGFWHLTAISAVDWIDNNEFEVYLLLRHRTGDYLKVSTRIPRDNPHVASVSDIWHNGEIHEREMHELFGIVFDGNKNLTPLFLEDWDGPPPFRKDFNWREYVREELEEVRKKLMGVKEK